MASGSTARAAAAAVLVCLAAVGCGGGAADEESAEPLELGGADEPTQDTSSEDTGVTDPIPTSYPDVELEFTSLPEVEGEERDAVAAYVAYERGVRELSRSGEMSDRVTDNASGQAVETMRAAVRNLSSTDTLYRGRSEIEVELAAFRDRTAILDICIDGSGLELVTDGQARPIEPPTRSPVTVNVNENGGAWTVVDYSQTEGTC